MYIYCRCVDTVLAYSLDRTIFVCFVIKDDVYIIQYRAEYCRQHEVKLQIIELGR